MTRYLVLFTPSLTKTTSQPLRWEKPGKIRDPPRPYRMVSHFLPVSNYESFPKLSVVKYISLKNIQCSRLSIVKYSSLIIVQRSSLSIVQQSGLQKTIAITKSEKIRKYKNQGHLFMENCMGKKIQQLIFHFPHFLATGVCQLKLY